MTLKNIKQEIYAVNVARGATPREALLQAGYTPSSAYNQALRFSKNEEINARIAELRADLAKTTDWDAAKVLIRLGEQADADILDIQAPDGRFKPLAEWPTVWRKMVQGIDIEEKFERSKDGGDKSWDRSGQVIKIKFVDRLKNLELLGRHKVIDAFVQQKQSAELHVHLHAAIEERLSRAREIAARGVESGE